MVAKWTGWRKRGTRAVLLLLALVAVVGLLTGCSEAGTEGGDSGTSGPVASGIAPGAAAPGSSGSAALAAQATGALAADTITVTGSGSVQVAPDRAVMQIGVVTRGPDAAKAADQNAAATKRVLDALLKAGIPRDALQTARVTVSPEYNAEPGRGTTQPSGFRADDSVTVILKDVSAVGKVFAAAASAGANDIYGPDWRLDDENASSSGALEKAVAAARVKAEALAKAAGVRVGDAVAIAESGSVQPTTTAERALGDQAAVQEPPVSPGLLTVSASVTVTYRMAR